MVDNVMNNDRLTAILETHFEHEAILSPMDAVEGINTNYKTLTAVFSWLMVNGHDKLAEIYAKLSFPEVYEQYIQENDLEKEEKEE